MDFDLRKNWCSNFLIFSIVHWPESFNQIITNGGEIMIFLEDVEFVIFWTMIEYLVHHLVFEY